MIVEREREIRAFIPQEYWLVPAVFSSDTGKNYTKDWQLFLAVGDDNTRTVAEQDKWLAEHNAFRADLVNVNGDKFHADNEKQALATFEQIKKAAFTVTDVTTRRMQSRPSPPFITSTLQQAAANRLGFAAKRTMMIAQQLYEGIDLGSMGALGLITYMRTDSTFMSQDAIQSSRRFIENRYGKNYLPESPNYYTSGKNAQEAHEAVRPTDPDLVPEEIHNFLSDEQYKLYDLIWRRFIACQMNAAQWDTTRVEIAGKSDGFSCGYRATGRVLVFDGFSRVWSTPTEEPQLPALTQGNPLAPVDIKADQHFTKPPARYTEASLVKTLEKEGIGRPSTYASIISTIQDRGYVEKIDKKFHATQVAEIVTDKLNEFFPNVMDVAFTRHMEEQLDKIEEQNLDWVKVLNEFYGPFKDNLEKATDEMKHAKAQTEPSEYTCPQCKAPLVYRFGKNGRFLSCSKYPDCKFANPCDKEGKMVEQRDEVTEHKCPNCSKPMVRKVGRFGPFLGCSDYPACKTILKIDKEGAPLPPKPPAEPTGIKCHKCKTGEFVIRQSKRGPFMGCNKFPRCRTIVSMKKLDELKALAAAGNWPPKTEEEAKKILAVEETEKKKPKRVAKKAAAE